MPEIVEVIPVDRIESMILVIRGQKVLLDVDLARLYGTSTKALNQAIKRNRGRFPADFLFRLTQEEKQQVVTICDHLSSLKFSPVLPHGPLRREIKAAGDLGLRSAGCVAPAKSSIFEA